MEGDALEIDVFIKPKGASQFGLKVLCSPDGAEETSIIYDTEKNVVRIDLSKTSLDSTLMGQRYKYFDYKQEAGLKLDADELLNFHVFIDKSVLEIFVNGRLCLTHRVYPSLEESKGVVLFSEGGSIEISNFDAWEMFPSNPW